MVASFCVNMPDDYVDMRNYVNIIMLHVDINSCGILTNISHVDLICLACRDRRMPP